MAMTRFSASSPPPTTSLNSDAKPQQLASIVSCLEEVVDVLTKLFVYQTSQSLSLPSSISPNTQLMVENPSSLSQPCSSSSSHTKMTPITPATLIKIPIPNKINKPQTAFKAVNSALEIEAKTSQKQSPSSILASNQLPTNGSQNSNQNNRQQQLPSLATTISWEAKRQLRREKRLCCYCGDLYRPGHRFKTSPSTVLEFTEERVGAVT